MKNEIKWLMIIKVELANGYAHCVTSHVIYGVSVITQDTVGIP